VRRTALGHPTMHDKDSAASSRSALGARSTLSSKSRVFDVDDEAPLLETARRAANKARAL
jgi:hypothetical protein